MEVISELSEFQRTRRLEQHYYLLHLTYHRNYNQHRVSVWWRHFNVLHRWVRKLLDKLISLEVSKKSAEKIRLRKQASDITRFLVRGRIFHNAYYAFNGIIALGQFVTLGLGLLAITSSIHSLVMYMYGEVEHVLQIKSPKAKKAPSLEEDDLGEEITYGADVGLDPNSAELRERTHVVPERIERMDTQKENTERKEKKEKKDKKDKKEKKEKKSKKKKSRNAIDDIFG